MTYTLYICTATSMWNFMLYARYYTANEHDFSLMDHNLHLLSVHYLFLLCVSVLGNGKVGVNFDNYIVDPCLSVSWHMLFLALPISIAVWSILEGVFIAIFISNSIELMIRFNIFSREGNILIHTLVVFVLSQTKQNVKTEETLIPGAVILP